MPSILLHYFALLNTLNLFLHSVFPEQTALGGGLWEQLNFSPAPVLSLCCNDFRRDVKRSQRPDISINSPSGHQGGVKEAVNSEANTFRPVLAVTWMNLSQQSPAEVSRKYLPASCCKI